MKIVIICLLIILAALSTNCWTSIEKFDPNGNHTSHCFGRSHNVGEMKENEVKDVKSGCARAKCGTNRDIHFTGCGLKQASPPCYIVEGDPSLPFPKCCTEVRCDDRNSLEQTDMMD